MKLMVQWFNRRGRLFVACGLLCLSGWTWRVAGATNLSIRYNVRGWQTDEGLPHNSVNAVAQTPDGYLWVGTREGLARFDGVRFTVLDEKVSPFLKQIWVSALLVTRDGSLWIGTENHGVARLKDGVFTHFLNSQGLPGKLIQCLMQTRDGVLWVGGDGGLSRFEEGRFVPFGETETFRNNSVKRLYEDSDGILRVATVTGLVSIDSGGVVSTNNFGLGPVPGVWKTVCGDRQGRLWLGATDGLTSFSNGKRGDYSANKPLQERITTTIYEDSLGQLWVGTYGGLTRRLDGTLTPWALNKFAVGDVITTIFEDREHNIWVGGGDGLFRLSPARFTSLTMQDGLNCNNVMSVREDQSGSMWFGTWGGGVNRLQGGVLSAITTTNGLTHDTVLSLCETSDRRLLVGMDHVGVLNRLLPGLTNDYPHSPERISAAVRVIHEDRRGALWTGTSRGLNLLFNGKLETFTTNNGLPGLVVMAICAGEGEDVWIGTDGGLARWRDGTFTSFTTRNGLSDDFVNALHMDAGNTLWIGTRIGGLNRLRAGTFTAYTAAQGLFSDEIYEIVEDDFGYFWMSCRQGIFRVNRKSFEDLDRGVIQMLTYESFTRADGLPTVQCNGVSKPAGWKSRDGQIWFPTIRGVVAVQPRVRINTQEPPVWIEEVHSGRQLVRAFALTNSPDARVTIPPGAGDVQIHFTALSYQVIEKVRFRYRIEEMSREWTEGGTARSVTFHSLAPGTYHFAVLACNNDGVWNESGARLEIELLPHYWQAWWFKGSLALLVLLVLVGFYRARVRRLRDIDRLRIRIASDLHDDVGSRLTRVAMVTELADREFAPGERAKTHIHNIASTVREITRAMDEIVWTINPRNDTLDNLANYIFQHAQEYFQGSGIRCRLTVPVELPDHPISTEERHNIFMAVKEAFNNVLKHSTATEVRVALTVSGASLTIVITDNGCGFVSVGATPSGNGLFNMRERLRQIGGRTSIESRAGLGTTVTFETRAKQTQ